MEFRIEEAGEFLARTPATLNALLAGLPDAWLRASEGPGTFTPIDVLGHLIYGEQVDWIPRAKIILEHGEARAFDPFDRVGFGPILEGRSVRELLAQFEELRRSNLAALRNLSPDLEATGTHPELGRVTMGQLLAAWVVHDLGHISQILRVLAKQYGEAVGPWRAYLSIVTRP
jgi:hypothetical protein